MRECGQRRHAVKIFVNYHKLAFFASPTSYLLIKIFSMWGTIARIVLKFRWILLVLLVLATALMAYHASKVQLSYEFTRAIPTDNPKYQEYQEFRKLFGEDGNLMVIGIQTKESVPGKIL